MSGREHHHNWDRGRTPQRRFDLRRRGMTLVEVMLALTLTCTILVAISMAIDLHLRVVDARRDDVERVQVARAVIQIIAQDLRSTVAPCQSDFSALSAMAAETGSGGSASDTDDIDGEGPTADIGDTEPDGDPAEAVADETTSATTGPIASSSEPAPKPGLFGSQYELQLDVSRVPRADEMRHVITSGLEPGLRDIPSAVKTVAYYMHDPDRGLAAGDFRDAAGNPRRGLVRRCLDRAVTLHAANTANINSLDETGEIIAPEIAAIEFQYFDGSEWAYEWDSDTHGGLPVAVRITVVMMTREQRAAPQDGTLPSGSSTSSRTSTPLEAAAEPTYSLVVQLPTARPSASTDETDASGGEGTGL